jgi:hypothetical protein
MYTVSKCAVPGTVDKSSPPWTCHYSLSSSSLQNKNLLIFILIITKSLCKKYSNNILKTPTKQIRELYLPEWLYWIGCGFDSLRFNSQQGQDIFPFSKMSKPFLGPTAPPILGLKVPRYASYDSILVLRLTKWSYTSTPPICLQGMTGTALLYRTDWRGDIWVWISVL